MLFPTPFPIAVLVHPALGPAGSPMLPISRYQAFQGPPQSTSTLLPLPFPQLPPKLYISPQSAIPNVPSPVSSHRHSLAPCVKTSGQNMPQDLSVSGCLHCHCDLLSCRWLRRNDSSEHVAACPHRMSSPFNSVVVSAN